MKYFVLVIVVCATALSCSNKLTPFTQSMHDNFNIDDNEMERIQFYLSEDIYLWRTRVNGSREISNGKIKVKDGKEIEEIKFEKGTPGVVVFSPKNNRVAVSFDEDPEKYLMFGPNKNRNGRYVLLAKEWKNRRGKVTYGGESFFTDSDSAYASLLVDVDAARNTSRKSSKASGRTIND